MSTSPQRSQTIIALASRFSHYAFRFTLNPELRRLAEFQCRSLHQRGRLRPDSGLGLFKPYHTCIAGKSPAVFKQALCRRNGHFNAEKLTVREPPAVKLNKNSPRTYINCFACKRCPAANSHSLAQYRYLQLQAFVYSSVFFEIHQLPCQL